MRSNSHHLTGFCEHITQLHKCKQSCMHTHKYMSFSFSSVILWTRADWLAFVLLVFMFLVFGAFLLGAVPMFLIVWTVVTPKLAFRAVLLGNVHVGWVSPFNISIFCSVGIRSVTSFLSGTPITSVSWTRASRPLSVWAAASVFPDKMASSSAWTLTSVSCFSRTVAPAFVVRIVLPEKWAVVMTACTAVLSLGRICIILPGIQHEQNQDMKWVRDGNMNRFQTCVILAKVIFLSSYCATCTTPYAEFSSDFYPLAN